MLPPVSPLSRLRAVAPCFLAILSACGADVEIDPEPVSPPAYLTSFPESALRQPMLFGGVVIRVSDSVDETIGELRTASLPPINVIANVSADGTRLELRGCEFDCQGESDTISTVLSVPVGGRDDSGTLFVDLRVVARQLSVASLQSENGTPPRQEQTSAGKGVWDDGMLIFDTVSSFDSESSPAPKDAAPLSVTVRWYLKPEADLDPDFAVRTANDQVGIFLTPRSSLFTISHLSTAQPIHYYVVKVPEEFRSGFEVAFADWNAVFRDVVGFDFLTYEFVDAADPRAAELITGDVRANVVEWNTENRAIFGGFGMSHTNSRTGEIFAASVFIQGPEIVEFYQAWFDATAARRQARSAGERRAATARLVTLQRRATRLRARRNPPRVAFGNLPFRTVGEEPDRRDVYAFNPAFDDPPAGETFESYMPGYFRDLVAHEIGHTLGLSHNFLGSLDDDGADVATSSVMEYTWRFRRNKARVGPYDRAAIAYGYGNSQPEDSIRYCHDGEVPALETPLRSAECSKTDAGADGFAFFRDARVGRAIDLAIGRDDAGAPPLWQPSDLIEAYRIGIDGMLFYATSAASQASTWTGFFRDSSRPTDPEEIQTYVVEQLRGVVCDPAVAADIETRYTSDMSDVAGARIAAANWDVMVLDLRRRLAEFELTADLCNPRDLLSFDF